jgi:hypothetical protein
LGGPGSTRWEGVATKAVIERGARLDSFRLLHEGRLEPGAAWILRATGDNFLTLEGKIVLWVGGPHQEIPLCWIPCHYGGRGRPLFRCSCGRRAQHLYVCGSWYACRHCAALNYAIQQERPPKRRERRLRKLLARMGYPIHYHIQLVHPDPPRRRRGQPWRHPWTYSKLSQRYMQLLLAYHGLPPDWPSPHLPDLD